MNKYTVKVLAEHACNKGATGDPSYFAYAHVLDIISGLQWKDCSEGEPHISVNDLVDAIAENLGGEL